MHRAVSVLISTLIAAPALLLAGCASNPGTIHYSRTDTSYSVQDLNYVAGRGNGELWTEVLGNPFGTAQPTFEQAVTSYMEGAHFGPPVKFTTMPSKNATTAYQVRMIFNGPEASNSSIVCGGSPSAVPPSPENGRVRLLAAFCRGSSPLTFLSASMNGASDERDPAFRAFVRQATLRLFPPQNIEIRDHERHNEPCVPPC